MMTLRKWTKNEKNVEIRLNSPNILYVHSTYFYILICTIMTKTALIAQLAEELGVSKKLAAELVNTFIDTVIAGVKKEGEVRIQGFGTFKKSHRKARDGVNPQNPSQKIKIPAMNVVTFKAGSDFKSAVK